MREKAQSGGDRTDRLLNRREYLTVAGGTLAAALGVGSAAANHGEGDAAAGPDSNATGEGANDDATAERTVPIGGGAGYERTVAPSEATVIASTRDELNAALDDAGRGDVVYVDGDAEIDMGQSEFRIPDGATLASDRGIDGSAGGLLRTDDEPWGMLTAGDSVRVTGLRVGGPRWEWVGNVGGELGLDVAGAGVEVDNCEVYGWGYAAVTTADDTHVHHCSIHHNPKDGTGYGVSTGSAAMPTIEYNEFYHNRHSVASSGGGYVARYNHVKQGAISHVFDQHRPGGTHVEIHHNTVEAVENAMKDKHVPAVAIRGVPEDVASVHDNWFHNGQAPRDDPSGWSDEAIIQVHSDGWRNVEYENNHYGTEEPAPDVGHPR